MEYHFHIGWKKESWWNVNNNQSLHEWVSESVLWRLTHSTLLFHIWKQTNKRSSNAVKVMVQSIQYSKERNRVSQSSMDMDIHPQDLYNHQNFHVIGRMILIFWNCSIQRDDSWLLLWYDCGYFEIFWFWCGGGCNDCHCVMSVMSVMSVIVVQLK